MVLTALIIFILHEVEIPVDNIAALNLNFASLPPTCEVCERRP